MTAGRPTIVATSGGYRAGSRGQLEFGPLVHHAVERTGVTGRAPRLCHVGTASGDQEHLHGQVLEAGRAAGFETTRLDLFAMPAGRTCCSPSTRDRPASTHWSSSR